MKVDFSYSAGNYLYYLVDKVQYNNTHSYWAYFSCSICRQTKKWSRYHIIAHYSEHFNHYLNYLNSEPVVISKYRTVDYYPANSLDQFNQLILDFSFYNYMKKQYLVGNLLNIDMNDVDSTFLS